MQRKRFPLRLLTVCSMMVALSIILGKYLAFNVGTLLRFSVENLPIIFTGIAFGPLAGALVGIVADLIGCLLVGYEINVLVTLGAATVGAVSGMVFVIGGTAPKKITVPISVFFAHIIGSVFIKTVGLAVYYGHPFFITLGIRALIYLAVGFIESVILIILLSVSSLRTEINKINRGVGRRI